MKTQLTAMNCALDCLFDYAGIFPPTELDLQDAVRTYRECRHGMHAWALECLVVRAKDLHALRGGIHGKTQDMRLSVVAEVDDLETVRRHLDDDLPIEMVEMKDVRRDQLAWLKNRLPPGVAVYIELPVKVKDWDVLSAVAETGMHVKLRMGGVTPDAFPGATSVAGMLKELAKRGLAFKATAGLHHPLRSRHHLTYREDSKTVVMHGFMNLLCAAALAWFGGEEDEAVQLLEEEDLQAWRVTADAICWRDWRWSADKLREVRKCFLKRVGSCSFLEPVHDLETLGWL